MILGRAKDRQREKYLKGGVFLFFFIAVSSSYAETVSKYPPRPLEFGVFPHLSTSHIEKTFEPIARRFEQAIKKRVNFNAQLSFDFFKEDLESGLYDIVFLQPFDYVIANSKHGYQSLAAQDRPLKALLTVRPSSKIRNKKDLSGNRITLPPSNTAISYLVRDWLKANGLYAGKQVSINYESSHISCLQKALLGFADVCGTAEPVLGFMREKLGFDYIVIAETKEIPHTLFAIHPRVSGSDKEKILEVILSLHEGREGKKLLQKGRLEKFRRVHDGEYDIVRKMLEAEG